MEGMIEYLEKFNQWRLGQLDEDDVWYPSPKETTVYLNQAIYKLKEIHKNNTYKNNRVSDLPGVKSSDVKPSNPQKVKEIL